MIIVRHALRFRCFALAIALLGPAIPGVFGQVSVSGTASGDADAGSSPPSIPTIDSSSFYEYDANDYGSAMAYAAWGPASPGSGYDAKAGLSDSGPGTKAHADATMHGVYENNTADALRYNFTVHTWAERSNDLYAQNYPYGSPFGDNPRVFALVTGGGSTGGFGVTLPPFLTWGEFAPDYQGENIQEVSFVIFPGQQGYVDLLVSAEHAAAANGYGTLLNVEASVAPGSVDSLPYAQSGPISIASPIAFSSIPWTSGSSPASVPSGACAIAYLNAAVNNTTVTLPSNHTLGRVEFDSPSASYTLAGPGSLTLACSSNSVGIDSIAGQHIVSANVIAQNNLTLSANAATDSLTLSGTLTLTPGVSFTKAGNGALTVPAFTAASVAVTNGTLHIASGATPQNVKTTQLTVVTSTGAQLDLGNNRLLIDYAPITSSTGSGNFVNDVRDAIKSGSNGNLWNGPGIVGVMPSSRYGLGYADLSALGSPSTYVGEPVDSTTIVVRQLLRGDANFDGTVNFDDLIKVSQNYNAIGKYWTDGDFNYDGIVNFDDLTSLSQNYNLSLASGTYRTGDSSAFAADWALAQSLVPEPTSLAAVALAYALFSARRR